METTSIMRKKSPLNVGIWCAYHITLEQSEGIGVFAHNLARGLASLPSPVNVTMVTKSGDEAIMNQTVAAGKGRIRVASAKSSSKFQRQKKRLIKVLLRGATKLHNFSQRQLFKNEKQSVAEHTRRLLGRLGLGRPNSQAVKTALEVALTPLGCAAFAISRVRRLLTKTAVRKSEKLITSCERKIAVLDLDQEGQLQSVIESCDVWLIPYVGLPRVFSKPTVVTIHDLVCYHFPEVLSPGALEIFKGLAESVSSRSTISACMSNFIRDNDLYGILKLPEHKVRVVNPAAPSDFGVAANLKESADSYPILNQKFIFYPSAFRSYKNHELLVRAISLLRDQGIEDLHLVFTGIHEPTAKLSRLISDCHVRDRVHILGKVDREVLSVFYLQAVATLVASRYEQGSFPLMEAMYWKCPIACSRIPSLTELFAPLGDNMLYFDTDDETEAAQVIRNILGNRETILAGQQSRRDAIFGRSWTDAAEDWKKVLEDAIELDRREKTKESFLALAKVA
jgi:glycosyltransferase involved in cell wall biosynthesis